MSRKKAILRDISKMIEALIAGNPEPLMNADYGRIDDDWDLLISSLKKLAQKIDLQDKAISMLAEGNVQSTSFEELDGSQLSEPLIKAHHSIGQFLVCLNDFSKFANERNMDFLMSQMKMLPGDYQKVFEMMVQVKSGITEEVELYLAIIDALPYRISVINSEKKFILINKILEDAMVDMGSIDQRNSLYGMDCCSANLIMCNTENCGITALKERNVHEYPFGFLDRYYRMDTEAVKNKKGEIIGYVEISHDTTPTMSVNVYTKAEVTRLAENLRCLANGELNFDLEIKEPNEYTAEIAEQFSDIEASLGDVKQSIGNLIADATTLTTAAITGELETRGDEGKFNGSWRELISGMNSILEEISKPVQEVSRVMDGVSGGNLQEMVSGTYQGAFDGLKQSVNNTVGVLNQVITEITYITGQISEGNLDIADAEAHPGDFGNVSRALNIIIETLNRLLGEIRIAAEQVNLGANQVSDGSQALAQGATEQASSIQELTASIAEIADQTKNNAIDANHARKLTTEVMTSAEKGSIHMVEMQKSMTAINQSSKDISKIIKVIDDIAFQTNILALNAAVEAARAGQHGEGFAVVAEEVRTLAARSAEAAKQTTVLIEGSITKVREGTKIADDTAKALNDIVGGIEKVTAITGNIAHATNEQATGIAQINTGIDQVAQVVQQNSATAEQSAAASQELSGQAELLKQSIALFELRKQ